MYSYVFICISVDTYMADTVKMLAVFERDCMDKFIGKERDHNAGSVESRIDIMQEK